MGDALVQVKFHGNSRSLVNSDPLYLDSLKKLQDVSTILKSYSSKRGEQQWSAVEIELQQFHQLLLTQPSLVSVCRVSILTEVVIPYLGQVSKKIKVDSCRARQIVEIVSALRNVDVPHPSSTLVALESVKSELREASRYYLFPSELLSMLDSALEKQWRPILQDLRSFLESIGGKLLAVAFVTLLGWPMVLSIPLFMNANKSLKVLDELQHHQKLSQDSLVHVVKLLAIMMVVARLVSILEVYQSVGITCAIASGCALMLSRNNTLMKQFAPIIAPQAHVIDQFLDRLGSLDLTRVMPGGQRLSDVTSSPAQSGRVRLHQD